MAQNSVYQVKDKKDFDAKVSEAGSSLVVIDFFATWCGPCRMITPQLEELCQELPNVVFLKVDVDECEDIATEYNIQAMPTFVFLKNKEEQSRFQGANFDKLKQKITELK